MKMIFFKTQKLCTVNFKIKLRLLDIRIGEISFLQYYWVAKFEYHICFLPMSTVLPISGLLATENSELLKR